MVHSIFTNVLWYLEFFAFAFMLIGLFLLILYLANINYAYYSIQHDMRPKWDMVNDGLTSAPSNIPRGQRASILQGQNPHITRIHKVYVSQDQRANISREHTSYIPRDQTTYDIPRHIKSNIRRDPIILDPQYPVRQIRQLPRDTRPICCELALIWFCRLFCSIFTIAVCYYCAYSLISNTKLKFGIFVP